MKNRKIDQVKVADCPMKYENCLSGCPFYCGWTEKITAPVGECVMCGWSKEMERYIETKGTPNNNQQ